MQDDQWVEVDSVLATTDRIAAYGGIAIALIGLERMAEILNSGKVPMSAHHDSRMRMRTRNVVAVVRERARGGHELAMTFEVHQDDWTKYGHLPGMSHTALETIPEGRAQGGVVVLSIAADAAWFDDDAIVESSAAAAAVLRGSAVVDNPDVVPQRVYQFSAVPDARIIVETSLALFNALGPNLAASAIWDGLKLLLARRKSPKGGDGDAGTTIEIHLKNGDKSCKACLTTHDPEVAKEAVSALKDAVAKFTFDDPDHVVLDWRTGETRSDGEWRKI